LISTIKGGSHVNYIADQIVRASSRPSRKKNKAAAIKLPKIKEHMWVFVYALIENPMFGSQTKETMTLLASNFGSRT
jgi:DNA topoisomerase-2